MTQAVDAPPGSRRSLSKAGPWLATALGALSLLAGGNAAAATVLSAGWSDSCGAQTCFNDHGTYSVTFSAAAFHGPVDISRLFLDRSVLGTMGNQFFNVSFTLNGESLGTWGNWNMGGVAGDDLWFSGQELTWNPADGDLVLVLELVAPNGERFGSGGGGGGWAPENGRRSSSPGAPDDQGDTTEGGEFSPPTPPGEPPPLPQGTGPGPQAGPVPEPATWLLMIGGLGIAGAALRRRRPALAA